MKRRIHAIGAALAITSILTFWVSTAVTELFASYATVTWVKTAILYGMAILIPSMITAGATGASLGNGWRAPEVAAKAKRMKVIAANGMLILLPSAIFLAMRAQAGLFDGWFYTVQALELAAGAVNITLLGLNIRDGLKLRRRRRS